MSTKESAHNKKNETVKKQKPQTEVQNLERLTQQLDPATIQRARLEPGALNPRNVLQLQRTIGNHAVGKLLTRNGEGGEGFQLDDETAGRINRARGGLVLIQRDNDDEGAKNIGRPESRAGEARAEALAVEGAQHARKVRNILDLSGNLGASEIFNAYCEAVNGVRYTAASVGSALLRPATNCEGFADGLLACFRAAGIDADKDVVNRVIMSDWGRGGMEAGNIVGHRGKWFFESHMIVRAGGRVYDPTIGQVVTGSTYDRQDLSYDKTGREFLNVFHYPHMRKVKGKESQAGGAMYDYGLWVKLGERRGKVKRQWCPAELNY